MGAQRPGRKRVGYAAGQIYIDVRHNGSLGCEKGDNGIKVTVNGFTRTDAGFQVAPDTAFVEIDGQPIFYKRFAYIMLNKPKGYVSATEDRRDPTVMDLLDDWCTRRGMFPVGRLDKDTTGLLLITDDGGLRTT